MVNQTGNFRLREIELFNIMNFLFNFEKNKDDQQIKQEDVNQVLENALDSLIANFEPIQKKNGSLLKLLFKLNYIDKELFQDQNEKITELIKASIEEMNPRLICRTIKQFHVQNHK